MLDKRYQVFISSTYLDLHEERQELIRALLELDCIPAGMELFPASDDDAWTLIRRIIDESDYYLVISAGRYGSEHPSTGISYTEMEYDYAVEKGKPIIGFLHHNLESLPVGKSEKEAVKIAKLQAFRGKVQQKVTKDFSSPDVLAGVASRAIVQLIKQKPGIGWVRAENIVNPVTEAEIANLRLKLSEAERELDRIRNRPVGHLIEEIRGVTDGIQNLGGAIAFINSVLPESNADDVIARVFAVLASARPSGPYVSFESAKAAVARVAGLNFATAQGILFSLASEGAISIDSSDDIMLNSDLLAMHRRLSLNQTILSATNKL